MSTTVQYKGNTLTTVSNATKTLKTAGKYMEGDVILTDESVDVSQDTVTPETLLQGYTAHDNTGALITGGATGGYVYQDAEGFVVLDDEGVGSTIDLEERIVSASPEQQLITVDSLVDKIDYMVPINDRGPNTGTTSYTNQVTYLEFKEYKAIGTINIINSDEEILDSYQIDTVFELDESSNNTKSIIYQGDSESYLQTVKIIRANSYSAGSSYYTFGIVVVYKKDGRYAPDVHISLYNKSGEYEGLKAITLLPAYDSKLILSYIERKSDFKTFKFPEGITKIGSYAFAGLAYLNLDSLPESITQINEYAFYNCPYLSLNNLPDNITYIGAFAFNGCTRLSLNTLPSGITIIYQSTFSRCSNLNLNSLPANLSQIDYQAFYECTAITINYIPSSVTTFGTYCFQGCIGITSIYSETSAKLSTGMFNGATSKNEMQLKTARFPKITGSLPVTIFGSNTASYADHYLEMADVGLITSIGTNSFSNCYVLQTLILRNADSVVSLSNISAFLNTPMRGYNDLTGTVYVPSALIESYKTATNWKTLYDNGTVTFAAIEGSEYEIEE